MTLARNLFAILSLGLSLAAAPLSAHAGDDAAGKPVVVFAAASLKNALDAVAREWTRSSGVEVKASYAASSALARQLEQDAPADLFISADAAWMDYVADKKLIATDSRLDLLGNRLVLVAGPDWNKGDVDLRPGFDLSGALGDGRLAMGDVSSVPAGRYGKAALTSLGLWDSVAP
ncbi:molybdate ABC transporter substrate-binding protein, partial [Hansschlegelia beijingensis]